MLISWSEAGTVEVCNAHAVGPLLTFLNDHGGDDLGVWLTPVERVCALVFRCAVKGGDEVRFSIAEHVGAFVSGMRATGKRQRYALRLMQNFAASRTRLFRVSSGMF